MSVLELDVMEGDDPNGTPVVTLTDEDIETLELRVAENALGFGKFTINRHNAKLTVSPTDLLIGGSYVKVTIPVIQAEPVFGFWLDEHDDTLIASDEEGAETLYRGGPGSLFILSHALLLDTIYDPSQTARGDYSTDPWWTWINEPYGAILTRAITEGQLQPGTPLADVTIDFDRDDDSDGNPWPILGEEKKVQVEWGTDVLQLYDRLIASGQLFVRPQADLLIQAYQSRGTDRTSATFSAGKVRFVKGVNIDTELVRSSRGTRAADRAFVRGKDNTVANATAPVLSSPGRWVTIDYGESDDPDLLEAVGDEALRVRTGDLEGLEFEIRLGDTEASGDYLPWKHFETGDLVRLHTGTGPNEYDESDQRITGFRVTMRQASNDDTAIHEARSLVCVVEMNSLAGAERVSSPSDIDSPTGPPHSHPPDPGPPPLLEGNTSIRFYRMGDAGGQDFAWPDFAQFQGGGANGSTYCAFVSGSAWISQFSYAAVAGATYRVAGYCKVGTRFPLFCFYDIGPYTPADIGDDTLIDARLSTTTLYSSVTGDVWTPFSSDIVAPSGTLSMGMAISGSGGLVLDEITVTLLGSGTSDPFALADPGSSPYFTRSDDPRIESVADLKAVNYLVGTAASVLDAEIVVGTTPGGELGGTWAAPTVDATHAGSTHPPTAADYLVGTTQAGLSAEIVVGTTPGGELGGTWASPTVDATHSGSTHSAASDTHVADTTAAHVASSIGFTPNGSIAATDVQAAIQEVRDEAAGGGAHAASHEDGGADEIDVTGLVGAGSPADILDIPTAETDDTLVLAPDGAGGVEFRAETGGSGGNVSTLPAGAITLGSLALGDRVPASPGTYDEEFEGTADTLPSDWAWTSAPSGSDAWFLNSRWPSLLTVEGTGNTTYTLTRTSFTAAATFGIWAKVYLAPFTGADAADLRFYISNSGATEQRAMNFRGTASRASGVRGLRVIASAESAWGTELGLGGSNGPVYFGMTRDGSNNFVGWYSKDGVTWDNLSGSQSHTITIDRIRITLKTNTLRALAGLDWIRYRTDNEFPRP